MARTNIDLDDRLVREGLRIYRCKSKRERVHLPLEELLKSAKRREILTPRSQVEWEADRVALYQNVRDFEAIAQVRGLRLYRANPR